MEFRENSQLVVSEVVAVHSAQIRKKVPGFVCMFMYAVLVILGYDPES